MIEARFLGPERMGTITQAARAVCKWTVDQLIEIREGLKQGDACR